MRPFFPLSNRESRKFLVSISVIILETRQWLNNNWKIAQACVRCVVDIVEKLGANRKRKANRMEDMIRGATKDYYTSTIKFAIHTICTLPLFLCSLSNSRSAHWFLFDHWTAILWATTVRTSCQCVRFASLTSKKQTHFFLFVCSLLPYFAQIAFWSSYQNGFGIAKGFWNVDNMPIEFSSVIRRMIITFGERKMEWESFRTLSNAWAIIIINEK